MKLRLLEESADFRLMGELFESALDDLLLQGERQPSVSG